jgi:hypothetical protein
MNAAFFYESLLASPKVPPLPLPQDQKRYLKRSKGSIPNPLYERQFLRACVTNRPEQSAASDKVGYPTGYSLISWNNTNTTTIAILTSNKDRWLAQP